MTFVASFGMSPGIWLTFSPSPFRIDPFVNALCSRLRQSPLSGKGQGIALDENPHPCAQNAQGWGTRKPVEARLI